MKKITRKILSLIIPFFIWCFCGTAYVLAAGEKVMSTVVSDQNMYVYIQNLSDLQSGSSVQIGNLTCSSEAVSAAKIADMDIPMRTVILIDNSKSIPEKDHSNIEQVLDLLIDSSLPGEQFQIGTISSELTYLCEFTDDKDTLKNCIAELTYEDQDTYLSDVLYDVISAFSSDADSTYTRFLVISDGADDKTLGYTNEEVRSYIEKNSYPVYTLGVMKNNNSSELETMFSFSRASSADSFVIGTETSNEEIANALAEDRQDTCIRIALDPAVQDGSNKSVLLKLATADGVAELKTSAVMPFGTGETVADTDTENKEEETENVQEELPVLTPEEETTSSSRIPFIMLGIVVIVLILAGVLIFIIVQKKKQILSEAQEAEQKKLEKERQKAVEEERKRQEEEIRRRVAEEAASAETVCDQDDIDQRYTYGFWEIKGRAYLVLKNLDQDGIVYKKRIQNELTIGRRDTDIVIAGDDRVSKQHCKIIRRGNLLYLEDMGSKNKTEYEHKRIYEETPIVSGGTIKIGRYHYSVELVME